jgi:hypothetical protein
MANTNGRGKTQLKTDTLHLRLPPKTIALIRKQAKALGRTMHAHAGILLQKASESQTWADSWINEQHQAALKSSNGK